MLQGKAMAQKYLVPQKPAGKREKETQPPVVPWWFLVKPNPKGALGNGCLYMEGDFSLRPFVSQSDEKEEPSTQGAPRKTKHHKPSKPKSLD